jgi:two-component system response regulator NreC
MACGFACRADDESGSLGGNDARYRAKVLLDRGLINQMNRTTGKVRVLLADDHAILRAGLQMLINGQDDMEVVAQASNGREAVDKAVETRPDVMVVDISMPEGGGVWVTQQLSELCPETRVLALTMHEDRAYLRAVLSAGASGFVVKRAADTELLAAIRSVSEGRLHIDASMGDRVLQDLLRSARPTPAPAPSAPTPEADPSGDNLSARERQVLTLLAHGYTNKQAAERLGLSMRSVETYRSRMSEKLGFQSRVDLVRYALETGLLKSGKPL